MFKRIMLICLCIYLYFPSLFLNQPPVANSQDIDRTSLYRVYQTTTLLGEYRDLPQAISVAQTKNNTFVEEIQTRKWVWNNFPRYQVYEKGVLLAQGQFINIQNAIEFAKKNRYRSVRDLEAIGWVWDNYPNFRLYQDDFTQEAWEFHTLEEAIFEGKKWAHSHIIDIATGDWVWDNSLISKKLDSCPDSSERILPPRFILHTLFQDSCFEPTRFAFPEWLFSSSILLVSNNQIIDELPYFQVIQNNKIVQSVATAKQAIQIANPLKDASVRFNGATIWDKSPYYHVYQIENKIADIIRLQDAIHFAMKYKYSSIRTSDQQKIWQFDSPLRIWGWAPIERSTNPKDYPQFSTSIDIVSPNFFRLEKIDGTFSLNSKKEYISYLLKQGYDVHLHLTNVFENRQSTSSFLHFPGGQVQFIQEIVQIASELQVQGINIDLEEVEAVDRQFFTAYLERFVKIAHQNNLKISVVIPGGSFDRKPFEYEKIGQIADYVNILLYALPFTLKTKPTTQTTFQYVEETIKQSLAYGIPRHKIFLSAPIFTRVFQLDSQGNIRSQELLPYHETATFLADKKYQKTWIPQAQQYKITFKYKGSDYFFWLEDEKTLAYRMSIAKKYRLAGVALWKLGYESNLHWQEIAKFK